MVAVDPAQGPGAQLVAHGQVAVEEDIARIVVRYRRRGGEEGLLSLRQVAGEVGGGR